MGGRGQEEGGNAGEMCVHMGHKEEGEKRWGCCPLAY